MSAKRSSKRELFRRSPSIVCYWLDDGMVLENFATGVRIQADPIACSVLDIFNNWRPLEFLFLKLPQFGPASLRRAVQSLVKQTFLQPSGRKESPRERAMQEWKYWNPAAGFFHFSTRDEEITNDPKEIEYFLRQRAKESPMPVPVKRYAGKPQIQLPRTNIAGEFPQVMMARRTWRRFSRRPVELSDMSTLLRLTWGVQRWFQMPTLGRVALKTSPSGGCLHPIEVYVLAKNVHGLRPGLYHYAADRHRLELLKRGATSRQFSDYLAGQSWYSSAAALMLMTGVFGRTQWKYQSPRAYRTVLTETGHLCQTFCLVATWLGLAPFCTLALADSKIEKDLGVDGVKEAVLYAAGIGSRPEGTDWAPTPDFRERLGKLMPGLEGNFGSRISGKQIPFNKGGSKNDRG
ncbi:MAG: SagB family peptide dehydrogenase [Acidobacteria bacterium]|nr:SagB family peptide dehydrogenase [Acidobacteriota bacterium]